MTDINTAALRRAIEETPPREWGDVLSREELLALLDELDRLRAEAEWQPIETAPRDGTEITGCYCCDFGDENNPSVTTYGPWTMAFRRGKWMASWDKTGVIESESYSGAVYKEIDVSPTHWRTLKPPTMEERT